MKIKTLIAATSLLVASNTIYADDFSTAHTFESGDVLSADMMNELFDQIENISKAPTAGDLVGTWNVTQVMCYGGYPGTCSTGTQQSVGGVTADAEKLIWTRLDTVTMSDDGDGTHSWSQENYSSLLCNGHGNAAGSGPYVVLNGFALFKDSSTGNSNVPDGDDGVCALVIKKISPTRIQLSMTSQDTFGVVLLDKKNTPPAIPTDLVISSSSLSNTLTWTDNSGDEVGFKVYKKTSATGDWLLIDAGAGLTVLADINTFTDTVAESGDTWYRVKSSNSYGDSIGSKVVTTTNVN